MEIHRLPLAHRLYLVSEGITTGSTIAEKELQGKESLVKFYDDCYREILLKDIKQWGGSTISELSTNDLLELRERCYISWYQDQPPTCDNSCLPEIRISRTPVLELDTMFVKVVHGVEWSGKVETFIRGKLVGLPADPTEETIRRAYHDSVVITCFEDVKKFNPTVTKKEMEQNPLTKREQYILSAAHTKATSNLSDEVRGKFMLTMDSLVSADVTKTILPYEQRLIQAYQSIGVPVEVVHNMIKEAKPPVTTIPECEVTTRYVAVPITPESKYDQWLGRVDKAWVERMLQEGWNISLVTVGVGGKMGPTMNI